MRKIPKEVKVRFIRITLPTGETEFLITSPLDQELKPMDFKEAYGLRWGIETFFIELKKELFSNSKKNKSPQKINQMVSYNKHKFFHLLYNLDMNPDHILKEMFNLLCRVLL